MENMPFWDTSRSLVEGLTISEQPASFIFSVGNLQMEAANFSEIFVLIN
jgi:hypothetical protein